MTAVLACALSGAGLAALAAFHFAERKRTEGPAFLDSWLNWFLLCVFIASSSHVGIQTWVGAGLPADVAHERVAVIERMIDQASVRAKPFLSAGEIPQAALLLGLMMLAVIGLRKTAAMAAAGVERGLKLAGRVYVFLAVLASFTFFAGEAGRFVEARIANARAVLQGAVLGHSDLARESRELAFDTIALSILESPDVQPAIVRLAGAVRETQQIEDARRYAETTRESSSQPERRREAETARRRTANEFGIDSVRAARLAVREPGYESSVFAPPLREMTPQEISARAQWVREQRELTATALYSEDEAEQLLKDVVRKLVGAAWSAGPGKEIAAALQGLAPNAPAELMRQIASKLVGKPIKDAVGKMAAYLARRTPLGADAGGAWASVKALAVASLRESGAFDLRGRLSAWDSALAARLAALAGDRTRAESELRAALDVATARLEAQVRIPQAPGLEGAVRRALRDLASASTSTNPDPLTTIRHDIEACESIADELRPNDMLERLEWIAAKEEETLRRSSVHDALARLRTVNAPWFAAAASPAVRNFLRWAETAQPHGGLIWRNSFARTAFAVWLNRGGNAQNIDTAFVADALSGDITTAALLDYARITSGNGAEARLVSAAISVREWAQKQSTQVDYPFPQFGGPGETIAQLRRLFGSQELATDAARNERSEALDLPIALALMRMGLGGRLTAEGRESVRRFRREMTAEHAQNPEMWAAATFPALAAAAAAASDRRRIENRRSSAESRPRPDAYRYRPGPRPGR